MKKKSQSEFVADVEKANPSILVLGEYANNATKIKVKCKMCGRIWNAVPTKITVHYKCPLCERKKSFESLLREYSLESIDDYQDNYTRVRIHCLRCNHIWMAIPKSIKKDPRCPKCYNKGNRVPWTSDTFTYEMKKRCPNIRIEEEYTDYETKIRCSCEKCGYRFMQSAHQLLTGKGCPKCNGYHKWTSEEFYTKLKEVNPSIIATGFISIKKRINCKCRICGYEWNPIADDVLRGHGCSRCSGHERLDYCQFKKEFEALNPTIEILDSQVATTTTKIKCHCKRCDNIWVTDISRLKQGNGCRLCNHTATSFMEQAILQSFRIRLGKDAVLSRNKTVIGKELDVFIPSKGIAFEPGSWYYHKESLQKDDLKRQLSKEHGIRLITIYDDYPKIVAPFPYDCIVSKYGLGEIKNRKYLKRIIDQLFDISDIHPYITTNEWDEVQRLANERSMRQSSEKIINDIYAVNSEIIVLGKPTKSNEKVLCRCKKCEYEWLATPTSLKQSVGCPECGGTKKLTQAEFEIQLSKSNPSVEAIESYDSMNKPILFHCNKCGYEWRTKPRKMIRQAGLCPVCRKQQRLNSILIKRGITITEEDNKYIRAFCKSNTSIQYTTVEYSWLISKINPSIEVTGSYTGMNNSISCKCKKCGNEWNPRAQHILNGHGCPMCCRSKKSRDLVEPNSSAS